MPSDPLSFARRILNKAGRWRTIFDVDEHAERFKRHNRKVWLGWANHRGDSIILIDLYSVTETNIARSYFANILAKKHNARIVSFAPVIGPTETHSLYRSFNTSDHVVVSLSDEQKRRADMIAAEVLPTLTTKQSLYDLQVLGVWVGIDIYEAYLKDFSKPTVVLDDPILVETVKKGIGFVIFWLDYFDSHQVSAVVVSHDLYLTYGPVCKVAYMKQVPVYLPENTGGTYAQRPHSTTSNFGEYRELFSKLPLEHQDRAREWARGRLTHRFDGEVGVDMSYTTESAFTWSGDESPVLRKSDKLKVLICTHCFYDNPHPYGGMLFLDFYEWLRHIVEIADRTDYDWYLKTHSDPLPGTMEVIREILGPSPRITILPFLTSHHQVVAEKINFVLTVYGTVGFEYPALGVQVINAGYNPRAAYDYNWHPQSVDEYDRLLLDLNNLPEKMIDMDQVYESYFMYHRYRYPDDLLFTSFQQMLSDLTKEQWGNSTVFSYFLDHLTDEKHQYIISEFERWIDSGEQFYSSLAPHTI